MLLAMALMKDKNTRMFRNSSPTSSKSLKIMKIPNLFSGKKKLMKTLMKNSSILSSARMKAQKIKKMAYSRLTLIKFLSDYSDKSNI